MDSNNFINELKIAVIPKSSKGISKLSSYNEIVNCDEVTIYSITDYLVIQNENKLPKQYWSFLIYPNKKQNLTYRHIDDIFSLTKEGKIKKIKKILSIWGGFGYDIFDFERIYLKGENGDKIFEIINSFNTEFIETAVYEDFLIKNYNHYRYEDLSDNIINNIFKVILKYETFLKKSSYIIRKQNEKK